MSPLQKKRLMGLSRMSDEWTYLDSFADRAHWRLRFLWFPKRSYLTGRWLWLMYVYEGTAMWTGPGDPVFEFRYHERDEHLIWKLKQ